MTMDRPAMDKRALMAALLIGAALGALAIHFLKRDADSTAVPSAWLAKVGDRYITEAMFIDEMHRRGGNMPGQYQDMVQKRALLDDMVLRAALVNAAVEAKMADDPDVRHMLDQILANQYLQRTLRNEQQKIVVSEAQVRAHYDAHAADYTVPARRRVAMVQILVPAMASEEIWKNAIERGEEVLAKARKLDGNTLHFGAVAREYSQDQASRYRGGMIGWITEGKTDRYRYDPAVLEAAMTLKKAGDFSNVLRGKDGVYVVRVVELEAERERQFEQLTTGIQQRLMQDRLAQAEKTFQETLLKHSGVKIHNADLERIDPLAPPANKQPPVPPAMPNQ
jgi:peptidyl-prolyl cis-trans isomerase C